jgi:arsenate reductase (glutaredoxin)
MDVIIYHNPDCGTSRNTLAMIRNAGVEPHVIEYLKTPPSRAMLTQLVARMGITARDLLREKGTPYAELGLDDPKLTEDQFVDVMLAHPILINRPIVVSPKGVKLCRPSEDVLDLLSPQRGEFVKEGRTASGHLGRSAALGCVGGFRTSAAPALARAGACLGFPPVTRKGSIPSASVCGRATGNTAGAAACTRPNS